MLKQLISLSPDLKRLRDEGYEIEVRASYLVVNEVPYVTAERKVAVGALVSELSTSGNTTATPATHEIFFVGSIPCDHNGNELTRIINQRGQIGLASDLIASCSFSSKPRGSSGYPNYYEKITAYVRMLEGYARVIDPTASARTYAVVPTTDESSVFRYLDSATSRARIGAVTEKLALAKVVVVGVGGTGSYIVDLLAKTLIQEIHLYDADTLYSHNAFRAPGAASIDELEERPRKVRYFQSKYDRMHRCIVPHAVHVDESNVEELRDASFVFLAIDGGPTKKFIIEHLEEFGVPFIDVGMGVFQVKDSLGGVVRTTTSVEGRRDHLWRRVSFADGEADEYDQNIQIADLNMLNAALAVIKWKKLFGFYSDLEREGTSIYTIDGNHLLNEDRPE